MATKHGFDPHDLEKRVRANGGCLYEGGTDMTYITREWMKRQARCRFGMVHFGSGEATGQSTVVLRKLK
jgi:hypothetical protein